MNFTVVTIFPEMFDPFWEHGIVRRAIQQDKISVSALNIRDYTEDRHRTTDDRPYGGGCGMVLKPEPLAGAIRAAKKMAPASKTILLSPQGRVFDQAMAREFSFFDGLVLVCGRYEGTDERICHDLIDFEVSIGDYVLTGGEVAAMVLIDAVTRLIPGTLGGGIQRKWIHFQAASWNMPIIPGLESLKGPKFRKFCFRGTTGKSRNGGSKHR